MKEAIHVEKNLIIFNAQAGKSDNNEIAKKAKAVLERHGQTAVLKATDSESDAIHAAATATDQYDRLITIGGDGSINTACAGFLQAGKAIPLELFLAGRSITLPGRLKSPSMLIRPLITWFPACPNSSI